MMTLDKIDLDKEVMIKQVKKECLLKRRLLDLGFVPGEIIKCVLVSPFKDPKAYKIRGNVIALRNLDAKKIEVEYERN